jgi:hypothetical protein
LASSSDPAVFINNVGGCSWETVFSTCKINWFDGFHSGINTSTVLRCDVRPLLWERRHGRGRIVNATGDSFHNLHDVTVLDHVIVGHGFADAPMTHSADNGNDAARTFGSFRVRLDQP